MEIKSLLIIIIVNLTIVLHGESATPMDQLKDPSEVVMLNPEQRKGLASVLEKLSPVDIDQFWNLATELSKALARSRDDIPKRLGELRNFSTIKVDTNSYHPLGTYLGKMNLYLAQTGDAYKNESNPNNKFFRERFFKEVYEIANIAYPLLKNKLDLKDISKNLDPFKHLKDISKELPEQIKKQLIENSLKPQELQALTSRLNELSYEDVDRFWRQTINLLQDPIMYSPDDLPQKLDQYITYVKSKVGSKALENYLEKVRALINLTGDAYKNENNPMHKIAGFGYGNKLSKEARQISDIAYDIMLKKPRR